MCDCNNPDKKCQDLKHLGTIYLIINLLNGKMYVGQTRQNLELRIYKHCHSKKPGIDAAIKKYGWENFKHEIIETCPVELLDEREMYWIKELNCKAPNGYNLTDGGDGGRGCSLSQETRKKISIAVSGEKNPNYGKPRSKSTKAKQSAALKGRISPIKGKKLPPRSDEYRAKQSASHKGKPSPNKGKPAPNKGKPSPNKGKPLPEEHKKNISDGLKKYWAKKKAEKNLENPKI